MATQNKKTPTTIAPLYKLTATHALELINNNTISVEEYTKSLLGRIEECDSTIKAWAYLDPAYVLSQAQALDKVAVNKRGPLHGLPIGIKDIMNTKGIYKFHVRDKAYT